VTTTAAPVKPRKSMAPWLHDSIDYYDYQVEDVRTAARLDSFLLGHQMGLGKSLIAITTFIVDVMMDKGETLLVVCPASLRGNWADELDKFTTLPYVRLGEVIDPRRPSRYKTVQRTERSKQIKEFRSMEGPRVLICNYEQIVGHLDELPPFHMMICDEAHVLKNPEAQRTQALHRVRRRRTAILTGTPILNQVDELWSPLHMINPTRWPNYRRFRNRYCQFGGFGGRQVVGAKNVAELNKAVAPFMIRRLKDEVLDLDKPYIQQIMVDLTDVQRDLYDQVMDELFLPDADGNPQDIDNALVKFLRLKQIIGSSATVPGYDDHSSKLDRMMSDVMDCMRNEGGKPIIFTQFRDIHNLIIQRLRAESVSPIYALSGAVPTNERQPIVKAWSQWDGPTPIVCMVQVAGVGLNMTASHDLFFVDKLFVPGLNDQAIDRAHRIGQTHPVHVREYIARGTIEARIERILRTKRGTFEEVVEQTSAVRKLIDLLKDDD
jgi:SNF2 family DNA or RNA helicase